MLSLEKPFADVRRHRFEGRRKGLMGHTGRRGCYCSSCRLESNGNLEIMRSHKPKMANGNDFSYLDSADHLGKPSSRLREPYLVTDFERAGLDTSYSLERSLAWSIVPDTLAAMSVAPPSTKKRPDGKKDTTFVLEATGAFLPTAAMASATRDLNTKIYSVQGRHKKLWKHVAIDPPMGVQGEFLKASLHCSGNRVPSTAMVRCNQTASAWDVATSRGKPLDIDLGQNCAIFNFSTQGRHPMTRLYPRRYLGDDKIWRVEDRDLLRNVVVSSSGDETYYGPRYTVLCTEADNEIMSHDRRQWTQQMYVTRYELQWREDGGRSWNSLGVFNGNTDPTTEVAHSFSMYKNLKARYLRVIPIDCEGGGAMRVGIYGTPIEKPLDKSHAGSGSTEVNEKNQLVTYVLTSAPEWHKCSPFRVHGRTSYANDYDREKPKRNRLQRRLQAKEDAMEAIGMY